MRSDLVPFKASPVGIALLVISLAAGLWLSALLHNGVPSAVFQDAMSREAQAERERRARIILGTAETEIAEKFGQAALTYQHNPVALHLRAMNMLYEAIKEKGAMVVVPSSAVETMGLGGMLGVASMGGAKPQ